MTDNMNLVGKCGFYCGSCPTYINSECRGCRIAHSKGDCFTFDCVDGRNLNYCGQCKEFPCNDVLTREKATVLDKKWLLWKIEQRNKNDIILIRPSKDLENQIIEYKNEFIGNNETHVNGSCSLHRYKSFDEWLDRVNLCAEDEKLSPYETLASTFLAVRKSDNKIIGTIQIRHVLTENLRNDGGNIGYAVRPTERKKGYATAMLYKALDFCKNLGLDKVLLDCDETNVASAKTMMKCGGVFDRVHTIYHTDKKTETVHQYWIYL